jgi:hypothetical protein
MRLTFFVSSSLSLSSLLDLAFKNFLLPVLAAFFHESRWNILIRTFAAGLEPGADTQKGILEIPAKTALPANGVRFSF